MQLSLLWTLQCTWAKCYGANKFSFIVKLQHGIFSFCLLNTSVLVLSDAVCANMIVSLWVSVCFSIDWWPQAVRVAVSAGSFKSHTHTNQPISLHMCICVCVCITERGTSCQDNGNSQIPHITFCRDKDLDSFQVFSNIAKENSVTANKQWAPLPSSIRFVDRIRFDFIWGLSKFTH